MSNTILQEIKTAQEGLNPALICRVPSGWVVLCDMQFLSGYCLLLADPPVRSLNDLEKTQREIFLDDMSTVGDALMEVTGAYRVNYAVAGNTDPYLHAHIVPRFLSEPEHLRKGLPWSYPKEQIDGLRFDPQRDKPLMDALRVAIQRRP